MAFFPTLAFILFSTIIGLCLLKRNGIDALRLGRRRIFTEQNAPLNVMVRCLKALGAFLLILPGFLTSFIAAALYITPVHMMLIRYIFKKMTVTAPFYEQGHTHPPSSATPHHVIEGGIDASSKTTSNPPKL